MPRRNKPRIVNLSDPTRAWGTLAVAFSVVAVVSMLALEKIRPNTAAAMRAWTTDQVAPIMLVLSAPRRWWTSASNGWDGFFNTMDENERLRKENTALLKWQYIAHQYASENEQLRDLLRVVPEEQTRYITARMVGMIGQAYTHMALIQAGTDDGIKTNQAVISPEGLIGRVIDVGEDHARVLLITDINANIPVVNQRSGVRAILTGHRGRTSLRLELADKPERFQVGDRLVTSGDGGMIPAAIPVASVTSVDGAAIFAVPLAEADQSSMVTVLDYQF